MNLHLRLALFQINLQAIGTVLQAGRQDEAARPRRLESYDDLFRLRPGLFRHQCRHLLRAVQMQRGRVCNKQWI